MTAATAASPTSVATRPSPAPYGTRTTFAGVSATGTAVSESVPVIVTQRAEDAVVAELVDLMDLEDGWDGGSAAKPIPAAGADAVRFIHAIGEAAAHLEPTLHADGSVLLEVDGGQAGVLKFLGDGSVSYAIAGSPPGRMPLRSVNPFSNVVRLILA